MTYRADRRRDPAPIHKNASFARDHEDFEHASGVAEGALQMPDIMPIVCLRANFRRSKSRLTLMSSWGNPRLTFRWPFIF
jgi:hypothetical protein